MMPVLVIYTTKATATGNPKVLVAAGRLAGAYHGDDEGV
jgi:hypothetical protein